MRCALSFLGVIFLVLGVSVAAFFIIWVTEDECPSTSFKCEEDGKCIAKRYFCDGTIHCKNGSDERSLNCSDLTNTNTILEHHTNGCLTTKPPLSNTTLSNVTDILQISSRTTQTSSPSHPKECRAYNRNLSNFIGVYCGKRATWEVIPWDQFGRNTDTLTLDTVIKTNKLSAEKIPHPENQLGKVYIENNIIRSLGSRSLCNMNKTCWLVMTNNSMRDIDDGAFCDLYNLELLWFSKNELHLKDFKFKEMPRLMELSLDGNQITTITDKLFRSLRGLVSLNLSNNKIEVIEERAFRYNIHLLELDLSDNRLVKFGSNIFNGQRKLTKLCLAHNPFEILQMEVFNPLQSLTTLYLQGILEDAIDIKSFASMPKLDMVFFERFHSCRFVPNASRCFPNSDGLSSTEDLLIGKTLRMVVWLVALLTIIGNVMVLASRWYNRRGRILDVFINNLAGADFLMGVYLLILAIKDAQYRNVYNNHAYEWSTSLLCSTIGVLAMISSEVSLLILTLMSLERYLVISVPFSHRRKLTVGLSRCSMAIIWVFVVGLAVAPVIQWRGESSFYGSTGLCFPLHLDDAFSIGWQYTAFVFIGLNSVCLLLITYSYGKLFYVIRKTRMSLPLEVNKDMEMAFRFFLMVITDLLCWTPIIILKIVVMYGHQIPKEIITWVLIFILPFSSLVNPFLYTFSTGEVRMKLMQLLPCYSTMGVNERENDVRLNANRGTTATENSRSNIPASNGMEHEPNTNSKDITDKTHVEKNQ